MSDAAGTLELDVQELAGHWMARFVENGVPLDDYLRTTAPLRRWSEWCDAWAATADARADAADRALARGAVLTAAELRLVAALEYHFAKFLFVHDIKTMRAVHARAVRSYREAMVALPWPGEALDVPFAGTLLRGVIRRPRGKAAVPAVLLIPGLDATKEELHRIEDVFLRRGMATFALDGPGQGEAEYELPLPLDWEHVAVAAVDVLSACEDIDADRIAAVGVSLGGYFAARAACAEPRLRAAASIGGCFSMGECWPVLSPLTRRAFEVRSGSDGPEDAAEAADRFSLASADPVAGVPFLVLHGGRDRLFDVEQARRMARHLGDAATLVIEPEGNHVLHNLAAVARPFVADWVASALDSPSSLQARHTAAPRLHRRLHWGRGRETVLLLHSLALDSSIWDAIVPELRPAASVLTCDLLGHGRSPRVRGAPSIEDMADAVADVVREEAPGGVVVWGLSLGGCVAQALAVRAPRLVRGLGLADTTAWYGPKAAADWSDRAGRARANGLASLAGFQLARWFSQPFVERHPEETARLLSLFERNDLDSYAAACAAMGRMDLRAAVARLRLPVAVVVGELDSATPPAHARDLAERIPESTLTIVDGCGHLSPLERPSDFVAEVLGLLRRCDREGDGDAAGA